MRSSRKCLFSSNVSMKTSACLVEEQRSSVLIGQFSLCADSQLTRCDSDLAAGFLFLFFPLSFSFSFLLFPFLFSPSLSFLPKSFLLTALKWSDKDRPNSCVNSRFSISSLFSSFFSLLWIFITFPVHQRCTTM